MDQAIRGGARPHARPAGGPVARGDHARPTSRSLLARTELPESYRHAHHRRQRERRDVGQYNVSPSLSPDGSRMMFFSDRDLFSIDLYLADARTGKVKRQVTNTAVDPHLQSLQFIQSAGSWSETASGSSSPGSRRPPGAGHLRRGRGKRIDREDPAPAAGRDPESELVARRHAIVFSAIVGGLTDLYVYDLETNRLRRLTDDQFADLQPGWSPDGTDDRVRDRPVHHRS